MYEQNWNKEVPKGYRTLKHGIWSVDPSKDIILPWHDWYALGHLIFEVHRFVIPKGSGDTLELQRSRLNDTWEDLCKDPATKMIPDLEDFLTKTEEAAVKPCSVYQRDLDELGKALNEGTNLCATGSPPPGKKR